MAFKAVNKYGMDAELAQRMQEKYDKGLEERIQVWIEEVTGITFDKEFGEMLQNGVVLCQLVNIILPGRIKKINKTGGLFKMQENITNFIKVCRQIGVPEPSLFPTESLAQLKDLNQVLTTINAFSYTVQRRRDELGISFNGPYVGPPLSKATTTAVKSQPKTGGSSIQKKKSKWVVKPGGSAGVSLLNQGSANVMEKTTYTDAREQIKRNQLDGKGSGGEVNAWNKGSSGMERLKYIDPREQIKRNELDGKGTEGTVSALNQGSAGMERLKYVDPREQIKRGEL